jgi:hypothetical protein
MHAVCSWVSSNYMTTQANWKVKKRSGEEKRREEMASTVLTVARHLWK